MKRTPKQSDSTMSSKRLAAVLTYLHQYARQWSAAHDNIATQICHAFAETTLGNGIGMLEADCVDDYLDETSLERRQYRARDERIYWENVLFQGHLEGEIPRFNPHSAFTFMDGAGRRFALPCYLLWTLQNTDCNAGDALEWAMTHDYYTDDLPLSPTQQRALFAAVQFFAQIDADEYDDGYYSYRNTVWQNALDHLSKALPDVQAA